MSAPVFIFAGEYGRQPVALSSTWPYIHPAMREKVKERLELGCYCKHDQERTATLTRRSVAGATSVWLQCDACGAAIGSAMSRETHPKWREYHEWDGDLQESYRTAHRAFFEERRQTSFIDFTEAKMRAAEEYAERRREYLEWCRTSPEWQEIRSRVLWRCRGHCEACLQRPAAYVHHLTYEFGKLPPAWHLKAVCEECHNRLHDGEDEWCASGMARNDAFETVDDC